MSVTLDIKVLAFIAIAIALIVFLIYLIQLMRKLIVTVNRTNKILEDAEVVSRIAAERSRDVDGIISNVSESVSVMAAAVKGKQNIIAAVTSLIKSLAMLKNAACDNKDENSKK